jgi:hypothetical protein
MLFLDESEQHIRERNMKKLIPILVILAGAAALVFGFGFNTHTVHYDEAIKIEAPPVEQNPFGEFGPPPGESSIEAPPKAITVLEDRQTAEPESNLVLEVTRGGVTRLDDGSIKRTYVAGEGPPALCPT